MATADDLLDAAQTLLDNGRHAGHWGRAISTAYYAAFHCIVDAAVPLIFAQPQARDGGRDWFEHRAMRQVASCVASAPARHEAEHVNAWLRDALKYRMTAPPPEHIRTLCRHFVELQGRRHEADYFAGGGASTRIEATDSLRKARTVCTTVRRCIAERQVDQDFVHLAMEMLRASVKTPRR
jgi:hypothetical protein